MFDINQVEKLKKSGIDNEVIKALASERVYQNSIWNEETTTSGGKHTDTEFFVFMEDYLTEAFNIVSRNPEPICSKLASENLRKIAAMILASAEENGWLKKLFTDINRTVELEYYYTMERSTTETLAILRGMFNKMFNLLIDVKGDYKELRPGMVVLFVVCCFEMKNNTAYCRNLKKEKDRIELNLLVEEME